MASAEFEIAVIGIALRTPQCENASQFWQFLLDKKQSIADFPSNRATDIEHVLENIDVANLSNPNKPFFPGSYFESVDSFDAQFFNISSQEAQTMDPQHRFFMKTAWEAMEDAGIASQAYGSEIGAYVGDTTNKYSRVLNGLNTNAIFGTLPQMIPSRLSYTFDLRGPTMVVGVGCSSSLLSIHLACQALRCGDCKVAIAGGVTIDCSPINEKSDVWNLINLLNTNDEIKCCPFDENAKGFVKGEGCAAIVLKPLSEAIKDGNHIYGVISGSAANQKGRGNGLATQNPKGLCDVTLEAWRRAAVKAHDIDYYEASGTSKHSVDVIEMSAIQMAFERSKRQDNAIQKRSDKPFLGAVTANVCNLVEGASGVTGLIKVLLALKNETIPPQINFNNPNSMINWEKCPFHINTESVDWKAKDDKTRIASVSSFGTSGTNVHLVVREFKPENKHEEHSVETLQPIVISAATEASLRNFVEKLRFYLLNLKSYPNTRFFKNLVYTLNVGRDHKRLHCKSIIFAENIKQLNEKLAKLRNYLDSCELKPITSDGCFDQRNQSDFVSFKVDPKKKFKAEMLVQFDHINSKFYHLISCIAKRETIKWHMFQHTRGSFLPLLPTYCFDEQRFWPEIQVKSSDVDTTSGSSSGRDFVVISEGICSDETELLSNGSQETVILFDTWYEFLGVRPTTKSHFFHCGGTDIKALYFTSKLRDIFGLDIRSSHIYRNPTFGELCSLLKCSDLLKPLIPVNDDNDVNRGAKSVNISSMQNGVLALQRMASSSTAYTECVAVCGQFENFNPDAVLRKVLERFPYLKSVVEEDESGDTRMVLQSAENITQSSILETLSVKTKESAISEARNLRPFFGLKPGEPLLKLLPIEITDDSVTNKMVVLFVHFVLVDDISLSALEDYLLQLLQKKNVTKEEESASFDQFCLIEANYLNSQQMQKDLELISRSFEKVPTNASIGFSSELWSETKSYDCESQFVKIENLNLDLICGELNIRPFHYFLSCYLLTLKRYAAENDLMTGITISTRFVITFVDFTYLNSYRSHTFEKSFGPFVNTVLYRYEIDDEIDLQTYIQNVTSKWLETQDTNLLPVSSVLSYLRDERKITDINLSNIFNFSEITRTKFSVNVPPLHSKAPVSVSVGKIANNEFAMTIEWAPAIIDSNVAKNFGQSFVNVCQKISDRFTVMRHEMIASIDVMSEYEYNAILGFNRPYNSSPILVHRHFEKHCRLNGNKIAVNSDGKSFTYSQLNAMADTVASFIQRTVPESDLQTKPIVLMMERNEFLFATILAVWKAGGFILTIGEDTQQKLLQIEEGVAFDLLLTNLSQDQIVVDIPGKIRVENVKQIVNSSRSSSKAFEDRLKYRDPRTMFAYMFTTSGTTGKPKRCMITHEGYSVYIDAFVADVDLSFNVNVLQMLSISFDAFLSEFALGLLCCSGTITVVPQNQRFLLEKVTKIILDNNITSCLVTPRFLSSVFLQLPKEAADKFRLIAACGEEFYQNLYDELHHKFKPGTKIVNAYGLTETTILSTIFTGPANYVSSSAQIPIGKAMVGINVYIVDPTTRLLSPIGTIGELCISGAVVGKGDVKTTKFKFAGDEPVFLSGDGARWLPDGNVDFIGRKTLTFYKIGGYRVNPREIESVVLTKIGVKIEQIRVFVTEDFNNDQILCLVYKPKQEVNNSNLRFEIRNIIKQRLPYYMMPNIVKEISNIPITSNGKTDLRSLREACIGEKSNYQRNEVLDAGFTEIESILLRHLKSTQPFLSPIDVNTNLRDQGIHSLSLMKFANKLLLEKVPGFTGVNELINFPSIKQLAKRINENQVREKEEINHSSQRSYDEIINTLSEVWKSILNIEEVNEDDIFHEIGGNDSLTITMMLKLREEIGVHLELGHCYAYPSLRELAVYIQELINESNLTKEQHIFFE